MRNRDVVAELGISRQAAHKRLRDLVERGELRQVGKGRATRYVAPSERWSFTFPTDGLREDQVWAELVERAPAVAALEEKAFNGFNYAVTELVNNAVDHSGSPIVELEVRNDPPMLVVEVGDEGVGIFEHIRNVLHLDSELEALQELSKGKTTTMPERHTGEGIFFTSKVADQFRIESGRLAWLVDNERGDMAVEELSEHRVGTRVRFEASPRTMRDLTEVFQEYTRDYEFTRTRTVVKLYTIGVRFISRSEAKRLLHGLTRFREVVLDFEGVRAVGQGFADEVFRVWHTQHPEVRLEPVRMSEPVAFMVERARHAQPG